MLMLMLMGCRPQIAEWVIGTFLAYKRKSEWSMGMLYTGSGHVADPEAVPQYLGLQRDARWNKLEWPDDSVGQRVWVHFTYLEKENGRMLMRIAVAS
jgi:hypothetical protein